MSAVKHKTVDVSELSIIKMVAGNEKKHPVVIDNGIVKHWVGIGWVDSRKATAKDSCMYPTVTRK